MRITFVLPFAGLAGGIRVVAICADRLKRRGHEVVVVSDPFTTRFRRKMKSFLLGRGWPEPGPSYFDSIDVEHRVLEKVRPVTDADVPDADVVVATYYTTASGVLQLSPEKGAKAIFIQNYEVADGTTDPVLDATWRMPMHKIVISRWLLEFAQVRFGDTEASLVPYGIDFHQFNAPVRTKQPCPTVGMLYSKSWFKGCRTSLAALNQVAASLPSLRLVCFGAERPGPIALRLPSYAEFHFHPPQDLLRQLYARCDVWLCGSNREGFHMPPMEAMACRCPVVSTRVGGPMDMIRDGVNGYLAEIGDASALGGAILKILNSSEEQWRRMSDAAYASAKQYNWDHATALLEKALELAIERNRRGELAGRQ
jgi:glycosyltransferase involved in cell wall biosynthesis